MGASDSKLVFKKGIFRLTEEPVIAADDSYWASFWELPESAEDIFSLFSANDIRRTRDTALENLETLILAITSRLFILRYHPSFPDSEFAPERDALNCIRILTRILPYLFELESLREWEDKFFWGVRRKRTRKAVLARDVLFDESPEELAKLEAAGEEFEEVKPLAEELIDTLIDLLFFADFTLPRSLNSKNKVTYAIWKSGVGCNTSVGTSKDFESNRTEILRLLLTLTSQSMYLSVNLLPVRGVKAISYIVSCPDKQVVLSLLCSLLNTSLKYNPASWRVPYNVQVFRDPKQILVTYALQLLLVILLYPIPENDSLHIKKNFFRHFVGRLHRPQDFQFIVDGMTRILNQPLLASTSYISGNQHQSKLASEMIMLFWEITQLLIIFYAIEFKSDTSKQGIVRMCVFILQTLSVEPNFGKNLQKRFEAQSTLPPVIRLQNFSGTYADFLIHSIYNIITTSQGKLTAIYPALLAVINNIAAYLEKLSASTCFKLLQLFSSMSSPGFLLANESNHSLLYSLLESINIILEHKFSELENPNLVYAVLVNRKSFEALRSFTLERGQDELSRLTCQRKELTPSSTTLSMTLSRNNSNDSLLNPSTNYTRVPALSNVPEEEGTFTVGSDEGDDTDDDNLVSAPNTFTPTETFSRASSVASEYSDAVPVQMQRMSEKARGKMPGERQSKFRTKKPLTLVLKAGMSNFSRKNSIASITSYSQGKMAASGFEPTPDWVSKWVSELPLHTILQIILQLHHLLPPTTRSTTKNIPSGLSSKLKNLIIAGVEPSPIRIQYFEWSTLSLGWYESLLWSFVFISELHVSKGTLGVWNGTEVKLFRVESTTASGPSLSSPRGAVDAVGSNIVSRIGGLNLRRASAIATVGVDNGWEERPTVSRTGIGDGQRLGLVNLRGSI